MSGFPQRKNRLIRFRIRNLALLTSFLSVFGFFFMVPAAATLQELHVGAESPDFRLPSLTGESRSFAELKGEKLTLIVFWSTWSKKSLQALSDIQHLYSKYRDRGLSVVAINTDGQTISAETMDSIKAVAGELELEFPVLVDQHLSTFHDFGVIALPSTLIVDEEKIIRYELSGYPLVGSDTMKSMLASALEGEHKEAAIQKQGYQPTKSALRLYNMGKNTLKSRRMAATAEIWFRKAIAEDPGFALPHVSLGKIYAGRGDLALGITEYEQALAKEQENVIALCEMGMLLVRNGKIEEGQSLFDRSMSLDEAYTPCYYYTAYAYGKQGNLEAALKMFEEAVAINPFDFETHFYKGRMYEELGRVQEAADAYRQAVKVALSLD